MSDKKPFSVNEDELIRELYERDHIKKWSIIAKRLSEQFGVPRNAKQCRDRYQKCLDPLMQADWSSEQQKQLYLIHDQIGNKWAIIAQSFPGKTDNCVKNHFYSKMRKALRHLNKVIKMNFKKQFKELKIGVLYKIIQALQDRFKQSTIVDEQIIQKCYKLKYALLEYADLDESQIGRDLQKQKQLLTQINQFSKNYKRKSKRERRNSNQGFDQLRIPAFERLKVASDRQQCSSSENQQFEGLQSDEQQYEIHQKFLRTVQEDEMQGIHQKQTKKQKFISTSESQQQQKIQQQHNKEEIRGSGMSFESINSVSRLLIDKCALEYNIPLFSKNSHHQRDNNITGSNRSQSEKADMFGDDIRLSGKLHQFTEMEQEEGHDLFLNRSHK